jgi:hypothetical protein
MRGGRITVWVLVLSLAAAACGDSGGSGSDDAGTSGGGGDGICLEQEGQSTGVQAGAVADRPPTGITYTDGRDIVEMVTCTGGVVAAITMTGAHSFSGWIPMTCKGAYDGGDFTPDEAPTYEFSFVMDDEQRLRGVSRAIFETGPYTGPGTYDASLAFLFMGSEIDRVDVTGSGTLVIEWEDAGGRLSRIGSFQGEVSGDIDLTFDVPIFGCDD